jgi:hypothetical protein
MMCLLLHLLFGKHYCLRVPELATLYSIFQHNIIALVIALFHIFLISQEAIGFDFSVRQNNYGWENVRLALETLKSLNGHLIVPYSFVVPADDNQWPQNLWGMKLGQVTAGIRLYGHYAAHEEELVSMGFGFDRQRESPEERFPLTKRAFQRYRELHGHLKIPLSFVVPRDDSWPEEMWEMKLGGLSSRIRHGVVYADDQSRAELVSASVCVFVRACLRACMRAFIVCDHI